MRYIAIVFYEHNLNNNFIFYFSFVLQADASFSLKRINKKYNYYYLLFKTNLSTKNSLIQFCQIHQNLIKYHSY